MNVPCLLSSSSLMPTLRNFYEPIWKCWDRVKFAVSGKYPVAHHGIQRSGTNFLCVTLQGVGYKVLNAVDPARDNPRHKHFRWQSEKQTIVMDDKYKNSLIAQSATEINSLAGYNKDTKHIVIFRDPEEWLNSIYRWGQSNEWFSSREEFYMNDLQRKYMVEWHSYYLFWEKISLNDPELVLIKPYSELRANTIETINEIDKFVGVSRDSPLKIIGDIKKVKHSSPIKESRIKDVKLDLALVDGERFNWERYVS